MYRIYLITNLINQKKYVGITKKTIEERWKDHIDTAYKRKKKYAIHNAINKYGPENFSIVLLEEHENAQQECYWIDHYKTFDEGYNLTKGGDGTIGIVLTEDEKIERTKRAKILHGGKKIGMYGRKHSEETKQKIRETHILLNRTGQNNPLFGKTHSEESKQKMRKPKSEKTKMRMSQAQKNRKQDISGEKNPMFGRKHSEETKQKIREARLKRTELGIA